MRGAVDGFLFWAGLLVLIAGVVVGQPVVAAIGGAFFIIGVVRVTLFVRGALRHLRGG
jgi:hypothetical protein